MVCRGEKNIENGKGNDIQQLPTIEKIKWQRFFMDSDLKKKMLGSPRESSTKIQISKIQQALRQRNNKHRESSTEPSGY